MKLDKIHEDQRGSIHSVTGLPLVYPEVSFLETKAGMARGGCIHRKNSEHLCVIQGTIDYIYKHENGEVEFNVRLNAGQTITIPKNTAHYMISITDSIIQEWGCEIEEKAEKHVEYRAIVMKHNDAIGKAIGNN